MRDWWPAVVLILSLMLIGYLAHIEDMERRERTMKLFQDCMADIHNVYVCETYAANGGGYIVQENQP